MAEWHYRIARKDQERDEPDRSTAGENIKRKEISLAELQKKIKIDKVQVENDKEAVRVAEKRVALDRIRNRDERGTLERAIIRLKENRI